MSDTDTAVAVATSTSLLPSLMQLARDPQVRPDVVAAFIQMQERLEDRQAEREFNEAFVRLQPRLPRIKRDGALEYPINKSEPDGPKRRISGYARWETIMDAIGPLLAEEGFALAFNTSPRPGDGGGLLVTAILRHRAGFKTETTLPIPLDTSGGKNNLQGYGSTLKYGQRYTACAALNIVTEGVDDDGVRGGIRYITHPQAEELRNLCRQAGRVEGQFLDRVFAGTVRSFEEVEAGGAFIAAKNTLEGIIHQRQAKSGGA